MDDITKLRIKRNMGIIATIIGLIVAYLGFDMYVEAEKKLIKLDQMRLDQKFQE